MNDRPKTNALFVDTYNSARSQMAEALLRYYAGDAYNTYSAGVEPREIDPHTIEVMAEKGITLDGQEPKGLRTYLGQKHFGYVFTVCDYAQSQCPTTWLAAQNHLHWDIFDPLKAEGSEEAITGAFRESRDQLDEKIRAWLAEQGVPLGE